MTAKLTVTWLGHATTLLELDGARLITDPVLRDRIGPLVRVSGRIAAEEIGPVDGVLLSHLHADHADPASLRELARSGIIIAPAGAGKWLRAKGLRDVHELSAGHHMRIGDLLVAATPAVHEGRRWPLGPSAAAIGYVICGSSDVYFAGDTDLFPGMSEIGPVDLALLPVAGWGPTLGAGHLDPERAARAAAMMQPRVAVPIHWGTFALGRRARLQSRQAPRTFAALTRRYAPQVEVRVLGPGDQTELG